MFTKITSVEELQKIFIETLRNKTNKVTKVSNNSVLSGVAYGCSKIAQKAIKDIAIVESHLFPDAAFGTSLDQIADNFGIAARFGASESSTYLRLVADPGTIYTVGVQIFSGTDGINFQLEETTTIPTEGFTYVKVRSQDTGEKTNIDELTINSVSPEPAGHKYVINEYRATGGRDIEQDDTFRKRIKEGSNILSRGTIAMLEQAFMTINNNVLKIYYQGINNFGQVVIAILTQNGINLSLTELGTLLEEGSKYFGLSELKPWNTTSYGILLKNIEWYDINGVTGIDFRIELYNGFDPDEVRKEIQIKIAKHFDFRFWTAKKVEWDDLLMIVKGTKGVKYVPDNYFYPGVDLIIPQNQLPRIRGFKMRDTNGNIISNKSGSLDPIFYPNEIDSTYINTVLKSL